MTDEQRDMLTIGLYQIRNEVLEYEGLAQSLVQSQGTYARAQTCQNSSRKPDEGAYDAIPKRLLEAMDEVVSP